MDPPDDVRTYTAEDHPSARELLVGIQPAMRRADAPPADRPVPPRLDWQSRPATLPPPNPSILDHAEPQDERPLYVGLTVGVVCAFVLYAALSWLLGAC